MIVSSFITDVRTNRCVPRIRTAFKQVRCRMELISTPVPDALISVRDFTQQAGLKQAKDWANVKAMTLASASRYSGQTIRAIVLRFEMNRNHLAELEALAFTTENSGYWPFVRYCRNGSTPHARTNCAQDRYDVVYGPLSVDGQELVIKDSDQVGFHTVGAVQKIPMLSIAATGNPLI
jgi:hypothetical protein